MHNRKKGFHSSGARCNRSVADMFKWARQPYKRPKIKSMFDFRYEKDMEQFTRVKPRRRSVGYIRAFVGPHFFAGCYVGAEND
jgi:hypothetical protein